MEKILGIVLHIKVVILRQWNGILCSQTRWFCRQYRNSEKCVWETDKYEEVECEIVSTLGVPLSKIVHAYKQSTVGEQRKMKAVDVLVLIGWWMIFLLNYFFVVMLIGMKKWQRFSKHTARFPASQEKSEVVFLLPSLCHWDQPLDSLGEPLLCLLST